MSPDTAAAHGRGRLGAAVIGAFYERSDGAALFCPDGTSGDDLQADYGVLLHPADEVAVATQRLHEWMLADLRALADELDAAELEAARRRIGSFVVIGSMSSGDPVVLDGSATTEAGEPPVAVLDHEVLLQAAFEYVQNPHTDVVALLAAMDDDPYSFLEDRWRYDGADGRQYYIASANKTGSPRFMVG